MLFVNDITTQRELDSSHCLVFNGYDKIFDCKCQADYSYFVMIDFSGLCVYYNYGRFHVLTHDSVVDTQAPIEKIRQAVNLSKGEMVERLRSMRIPSQLRRKNDRSIDGDGPLLKQFSQSSLPLDRNDNYRKYLKVQLQAGTTSIN